MANPFPIVLGNLNQLGVFQFLFPFLLVLAIAYGVLHFTLGGAGDDKKKILPKSAIALISIIIAFFVMNYSGGLGNSLAIFFSQLFGQGMVIAVGVLLLMILIGLFGITPSELLKKEDKSDSFKIIVGLLAIFVVIIFAAAGNYIGLGGLNLASNYWTAIIFIIILAAVVWALSREPSAKKT